ncbi:MAG: hypothetical protein RRA94_13060 [Bacteroidota bacterium]|nr:hypothetical protein [Bacteroidota bacterium]
MRSFVGKKNELFDFMRDNDFPVYHASNIFYRDLQYAIRDYVRAKEGKDIGWRESDALAATFVRDLEEKDVLRPFSRNTWVLNDTQYLLPSTAETTEEEIAATEDAGA